MQIRQKVADLNVLKYIILNCRLLLNIDYWKVVHKLLLLVTFSVVETITLNAFLRSQ